jgi:hypothetical protein
MLCEYVARFAASAKAEQSFRLVQLRLIEIWRVALRDNAAKICGRLSRIV